MRTDGCLAQAGDMNTTRGLLAALRALLLGLVLVAVSQGLVALIARVWPSTDANIGAGLLAFALAGLVALAWCVVEGRRHGMLIGVLVAVLAGVAWTILTPVWVGLAEGGAASDVSVMFNDFLIVMPLMVGLVAAPGTVGALIGQALRGPGTSHGTP